MKIYTKKGDKGETFLANGSRVYKYDLRVELYGICDELNSYIGVVNSFIQDKYQLNPQIKQIWDEFIQIQNLLFEIGSELAGYYKNNQTILKEEDIIFLEKSIDRMNETLPALKSFILPGGSIISTFLHLCRTHCRKLERKLVFAIKEKQLDINEKMIQYFNRLSDYFFVASRYVNFVLGFQERQWQSTRKKN